MRVLIFSAFDPIPSEGIGIIRYPFIAQEFLKNGWEVDYLTSSFSHLTKKQREIKWDNAQSPTGLHLTLLNASSYESNKSIKRIWSYYQLRRNMKSFLMELRKDKFPKLIISATPPLMAVNILASWANENNIPFILDVQDLWPHAFKRFLPEVISRPLTYPLMNISNAIREKADAISAVSEDYLKGERKPSKAFPLGTETEKFQLSPDNGALNRKILMIGSAHETKYLNEVIEAVKSIQSIELVVVGMGKSTKAGNVSFLPWMSKEEIYSLAGKYQVGLVLKDPESYSALPNRVFSYLAAGIPIVSNIRGGELERIISENDLGITIENATSVRIFHGLKHCLKYSFEDQKRIQQFAKEHFNSKNIYKEYIEWSIKISRNNS